jgi:hypothetical protein
MNIHIYMNPHVYVNSCLISLLRSPISPSGDKSGKKDTTTKKGRARNDATTKKRRAKTGYKKSYSIGSIKFFRIILIRCLSYTSFTDSPALCRSR